MAMNDSAKWWFWSAGALKVVGDRAQLLAHCLSRLLLNSQPSRILDIYEGLRCLILAEESGFLLGYFFSK